MFNRTNERERSRLSEALDGGAPAPDAADSDHPAQAAPVSRAPDDEQAPGDSPGVPRPNRDVNLSIGRPNRPAAPARPEAETLISERSFFDGMFRTEESIRIRGTVQGHVESTASVIIEAEATVTATVVGLSVTVAGQVDGQIACSGRVELLPSARVTGEISAGTLIMQEGAFFEGQLTMAGAGNSPVAVTTSR